MGVLEGVLLELVEEVSLLPSPLLHFIRTLAGSYNNRSNVCSVGQVYVYVCVILVS